MRVWSVAVCCYAFCLCALTAEAAEPARPAPPAWTPAESERLEPHHIRSLLEMGGGLALGTAGYWLLKRQNASDWDNPRPLARFDGAAWSFDNNTIGVNFLGHPLTGAWSYSFARANHQSVAGAFGYSFLTSFLWEFGIEFKEQVSVNDVIVTPGAGLPLGEFFYKLGLYLDSGHHDSVAMDVARALLGGGVALDRALDGRPAPRLETPDNLGFSSTMWHEFSVRYATSDIRSPGEPSYPRFEGGLSAKLVTLPRYGAPGRFARAFYGAELSTFSLLTEGSRHGWGLAVAGDTTLFGYHAQALARTLGQLTGESVTVGSSVGYDYLRSGANRYASVERAVALPQPELDYSAPNRHEQYAGLQLPGISAELKVLRSWGGFQGSGRIQPSFAGLGATAFYAWAAANRNETTKHILHSQGYFYGWGAAMNATARGSLGPLRASFELSYGAYFSQDGMDRHLDQLTVDVRAKGDLLRYRAALGVAPGEGSLIALELGVRRFRSNVGGFESTARSVERGISGTWTF